MRAAGGAALASRTVTVAAAAPAAAMLAPLKNFRRPRLTKASHCFTGLLPACRFGEGAREAVHVSGLALLAERHCHGLVMQLHDNMSGIPDMSSYRFDDNTLVCVCHVTDLLQLRARL